MSCVFCRHLVRCHVMRYHPMRPSGTSLIIFTCNAFHAVFEMTNTRPYSRFYLFKNICIHCNHELVSIWKLHRENWTKSKFSFHKSAKYFEMIEIWNVKAVQLRRFYHCSFVDKAVSIAVSVEAVMPASWSASINLTVYHSERTLFIIMIFSSLVKCS